MGHDDSRHEQSSIHHDTGTRYHDHTVIPKSAVRVMIALYNQSIMCHENVASILLPPFHIVGKIHMHHRIRHPVLLPVILLPQLQALPPVNPRQPQLGRPLTCPRAGLRGARFPRLRRSSRSLAELCKVRQFEPMTRVCRR